MRRHPVWYRYPSPDIIPSHNHRTLTHRQQWNDFWGHLVQNISQISLLHWGENGEVQCEDLRATSSSLVIVHGTWSFYARVKITVQIIMCENYFQKLCSRGVYTICFTPNWGNLNQPASGPGHISSQWQLVIMNVIFSSRVVTRPRRCMQHTTFYAAQGMKKDLFALYGQKMMVNYNSFIHPKLR